MSTSKLRPIQDSFGWEFFTYQVCQSICVTRLVLASTSPARLRLLRDGGIEPDTIAPGVDEDALVERLTAEGLIAGTADMVLALARAKAEAVLDNPIARDAIVIGCDSSLEFAGEALGKPHEPHVARERWMAMRGNSGTLFSGHWVIDNRQPQPGRLAPAAGRVSASVVHFADITDAEIDAYVATGEPLKVAGAFTIDGLGGAFLRGIEGDSHTVVGLSLPTLRDLVRELGVEYTSLWNRA
jgi:septum formation protein